jgi:hypothetical protein
VWDWRRVARPAQPHRGAQLRPVRFKPNGRFSDEEAFDAVADSVLLMFGVGSPPQRA